MPQGVPLLWTCGPPPHLVENLQRIQQAAEQMQRSGQDARPIQKLMQQAGPLL